MNAVIEPFDATTASDATLESVHRCYTEMEQDFFGGRPTTPISQHLRDWQVPAADHRKDLRFVARVGYEVVGTARVAVWFDHADSGLIEVAVRRDRRRNGHGTALFRTALDALSEEGRSKAIVDIPIGSPLEPEAERVGLSRVFSEEINELHIADIDWDLMATWMDRASDRAAAYELLFLTPPIPDEHMPNWCRVSDVMNTAPMEEFDLEETTMTADKWRSIEANFAARGYVLHALVAVHEPTGDFAGMTTLIYQTDHPAQGLQDDTVVDPDHRNKGLGRLLKAAMIQDFVAAHPDVERIETGNAGSNAPMLGINKEMGFRTILEISAWQGEIDNARRSLVSS